VAYPGNSASRANDSALSTLPLLAYAALAIALMVFDHRSGYGAQVRQRFAVVAEPFRWLAAAPTRLFSASREGLALRERLQTDNERMRKELAIATARLNRLDAVSAENQRLRELLGGTRGYRLNVRLVGIFEVDLDPYRQRLVLDAGNADGVQVGDALIDAGGVLGQVIEVSPHRAIALLLTDPDHAVPVQVARSGLRATAIGTGHGDRRSLPNIPQSADIRVGDVLITSGIGGRFPAGFPVGVISELHPDSTGLFMVAEARPAARLDRGVEVLLVSNLPPQLDVGPPAPKRAARAASAAPVAMPAPAQTIAPAAPSTTETPR
jgi:rod shape-determining protein MreC